MPEYLKGNYHLDQSLIDIVKLELEDETSAEFKKRCDEIQRAGVGLAGSVPYVDMTRLKNGKFLWHGMTDAERAAAIAGDETPS
jgi:hypothetical protein